MTTGIISGSIDLESIDKTKLAKGKYLQFDIILSDESKYGNNAWVVQGQSKEEREAKEKKVSLGTTWSGASSTPGNCVGQGIAKEPQITAADTCGNTGVSTKTTAATPALRHPEPVNSVNPLLDSANLDSLATASPDKWAKLLGHVQQYQQQQQSLYRSIGLGTTQPYNATGAIGSDGSLTVQPQAENILNSAALASRLRQHMEPQGLVPFSPVRPFQLNSVHQNPVANQYTPAYIYLRMFPGTGDF